MDKIKREPIEDVFKSVDKKFSFQSIKNHKPEMFALLEHKNKILDGRFPSESFTVAHSGIVMTAYNQETLDNLIENSTEHIRISFGTPYSPAIINGEFKGFIIIDGESYVVADGSKLNEVFLEDKSWMKSGTYNQIVAMGESTVVCKGDCKNIYCYDNSHIHVLREASATILARENSNVIFEGKGSIFAGDECNVKINNAEVIAYMGQNSHVFASKGSIYTLGDWGGYLFACGNAELDLWGKGKVDITDNVVVERAWFDVQIKASGNAIIKETTDDVRITLTQSAKIESMIIYNDIKEELMDFIKRNNIQCGVSYAFMYRIVHPAFPKGYEQAVEIDEYDICGKIPKGNTYNCPLAVARTKEDAESAILNSHNDNLRMQEIKIALHDVKQILSEGSLLYDKNKAQELNIVEDCFTEDYLHRTEGNQTEWEKKTLKDCTEGWEDGD